MNGYSRGATEKKSTNSKLMFSSVCNARGRCGWCFIPNWVAAHFLAFQVADSSEWQVELFARNSASQTARARYAHTDTHTRALLFFFRAEQGEGSHAKLSLTNLLWGWIYKELLFGVRGFGLKGSGYFGQSLNRKAINNFGAFKSNTIGWRWYRGLLRRVFTYEEALTTTVRLKIKNRPLSVDVIVY